MEIELDSQTQDWFSQLVGDIASQVFGPKKEALATVEGLIKTYEPAIHTSPCAVSKRALFGTRTCRPQLSTEIIQQEFQQHDWLFPRESISTLEDLIGLGKSAMSYAPEQIYDSANTVASSHVFGSHHLAYVVNISNCSYLGYASNCRGVMYGLMADNCFDSEYILRVFDSSNLSGCFDCYDSARSANCYGLSNCYDLRDCIFCSHLASRQWCVGNMQFSAQEFYAIKDKYLEGLCSDNWKRLLVFSENSA